MAGRDRLQQETGVVEERLLTRKATQVGKRVAMSEVDMYSRCTSRKTSPINETFPPSEAPRT